MVCDMTMRREVLKEKLAEQGWNEDEIDLLEKEIELARQKAKAESYKNGETLSQQERRMRIAEQEARKIAHDRMHAKLDDMMQDIKALGDAKKIPHGDKVH